MSDKNINTMDFKSLRNEVQSLRDELAIMKRKYEDILYNLDDDNFSSRIVKERDNMKAEISVTAEEIKTKVSATDLATSLLNYSTISQTASAISSVVSSGANLKDAIEISNISQATDITKTYKIPTYNANGKVVSESYYYYNSLSKQWEKISGDTIYTMFTQTAEGFVLKGNTIIDGNTTITRNLTLSGNVTWDMSNSPVKTQYSADSVIWHELQTANDMYMRMSFDGGSTWSNPTKVVGTDGQNGQDGRNGSNGSDANVTPQNVFNALTNNAAQQGIFAAFVKDNNQLYINAEYIQAGILRGQTIQSFMSSESSGYGTYAELNGNVGSLDFYYKPSGSSRQQRFTMFQQGGATYIKNIDSTLYIGNNSTSDSTNTTYPVGTWNFKNADVDWGDNAPVAVFG